MGKMNKEEVQENNGQKGDGVMNTVNERDGIKACWWTIGVIQAESCKTFGDLWYNYFMSRLQFP